MTYIIPKLEKSIFLFEFNINLILLAEIKVFLSTDPNPTNRILIIEGASHFSPVRINENISKNVGNDDIFKINKSFVGSNPSSVQDLSLKVILKFL